MIPGKSLAPSEPLFLTSDTDLLIPALQSYHGTRRVKEHEVLGYTLRRPKGCAQWGGSDPAEKAQKCLKEN